MDDGIGSPCNGEPIFDLTVKIERLDAAVRPKRVFAGPMSFPTPAVSTTIVIFEEI